jgi:protein TonB
MSLRAGMFLMLSAGLHAAGLNALLPQAGGGASEAADQTPVAVIDLGAGAAFGPALQPLETPPLPVAHAGAMALPPLSVAAPSGLTAPAGGLPVLPLLPEPEAALPVALPAALPVAPLPVAPVPVAAATPSPDAVATPPDATNPAIPVPQAAGTRPVAPVDDALPGGLRPQPRPETLARARPVPAAAPPAPDTLRPTPAPQSPPAAAAPRSAMAAPPSASATPPRASALTAQSYGAEVLRRIQARPAPRAPGRGVVRVAFTLGANGAVASIRVARSSGNPALDRIALDHIRAAAPFPPPPDGAGRAFSFEFAGR